LTSRDSTILLTGSTGFVGQALLPALLEQKRSVRCLVRNQGLATPCAVEAVSGDLLKPETLQPVFDGIDTAYYLVHSLSAGPKRFSDLDHRAAENFTEAASKAGVRHVIYLSGLGEQANSLSRHLASRGEVTRVLSGGPFELTTFRAAIIIGAGGASFELLRFLVRTQPVLLESDLLQTRCQPIALRDVIHYLTACLDEPRIQGQTCDIGGPEVLSYHTLLERMAAVANTVNLYLPVPSISSRWVGRWVGLLSRLDSKVVEALLEGLGNEVICRDQSIRKLVPFSLTPLDKAIRMALGDAT